MNLWKKRHSLICYIISFTFFFVAQSFIVQAVIIMLKFFKVNLQSWNGVFFALIFIFCLAHSMLVAETDQANKTSVIIYFFKYNSTFLMKRFLKVWIFTPKLTKISNGTFEYLRLKRIFLCICRWSERLQSSFCSIQKINWLPIYFLQHGLWALLRVALTCNNFQVSNKI